MFSIEQAFLISLTVYLFVLSILKFCPFCKKSLSRSVYISNCSSWFENYILLKTENFKNYPSGGLYFLKAIGNAAFFISLTFVIFKLYVSKIKFSHIAGQFDPLTISFSIILLVLVLYWNERKNYLEKWEYLANLYNKSLEFEMQAQREMILVSLYHDIHLTEMWGHKTFYSLFVEAIIEAKKIKDPNLVLTGEEVEELLGKLQDEKVSLFREACRYKSSLR